MPEINVTLITLLVAALIIGILLGWMARGGRSESEKNAINAGWQEQLEAQRAEHNRLTEQNKSLMEQNSQYQASNKDSRNRSSELADSLKEALARRDELQRQIKDIRSELETAMTARDQLQSEIGTREDGGSEHAEQAARDQETIARLTRELKSWQERVPPLVERFRIRNEEAMQLETDLAEANVRIEALEGMVGSEHTRVEPVDPEALGDDLYASNDSDEDDEIAEELAEEFEDVMAEVIGDDDLEDSDEAEDEAVSDEDDSDDDQSESSSADILPFASQPDDDADDDHSPEDEGSGEHPAVEAANDSDNLKRIKGIGPSIEKTLNEMGIWRFEQIADMSEYDINRVAQRLKGFRSRIYREDWIGQARELHEKQLSSQA